MYLSRPNPWSVLRPRAAGIFLRLTSSQFGRAPSDGTCPKVLPEQERAVFDGSVNRAAHQVDAFRQGLHETGRSTDQNHPAWVSASQ
jgi:hypothetical protein